MSDTGPTPAPLQRPPRRGPLPVRAELGLAAFAPALALVGVRSWGQWWAWAFLGAATLGLVVLVVGATLVATGEEEDFELIEIRDVTDQVLGHVGSYLVPVLIDTSASGTNAVLGAVTLALVIHLHVATGRVHLNPLLYLLGYRVYDARTGTHAYYLLARSEVAGWDRTHACVDLASSVLVERNRR